METGNQAVCQLHEIDPTLIFRFLEYDDRIRFSFCSRKSHLRAKMFENMTYARLEARKISPESWRTGLCTRGGGYKWKELKKRLEIPPSKTAERVHQSNLTVKEFESKFEEQHTPVIILGITEDWPAKDKWSFQKLVERFGDKVEFRFDDHFGELITLRQYDEYIRTTTDDCPLGLYDSQFGEDEDSLACELAKEYSVPSYFQDDIFRHAESDEESRPPWRWLLIGTERSGTELHVDPLYTSAWVTLLEGRKRWCMFPPGTPVELLGGAVTGNDSVCNMNALEWFLKFHDNYPEGVPPPIDILQTPGETVFVPAGCPHIVINLETTVSATQNYASKCNALEIWNMCKDEEPEFAERWFKCLQEQRADVTTILKDATTTTA